LRKYPLVYRLKSCDDKYYARKDGLDKGWLTTSAKTRIMGVVGVNIKKVVSKSSSRFRVNGNSLIIINNKYSKIH
jgi:hypothetical protein